MKDPDKTQNKTAELFTVIQQAFTFLSDHTKRAALDKRLAQARDEKERRAKQAQTATRHRQRVEKTPSAGAGSGFGVVGNAPPTAQRSADGGTSFPSNKRNRPQSAPVRRNEHSGAQSYSSNNAAFNAARSSAGRAAHRSGKAAEARVIARPTKLRLLERTDCCATLSWDHGDFDKATMATSMPGVLFELQWRSRMERAMPPWETSSFLLRSNTCRKKNLRSSTCYEFRIRATSTNGKWSAFSDTAFAVTLGKASKLQPATDEASSDNQGMQNQHQHSRTSTESVRDYAEGPREEIAHADSVRQAEQEEANRRSKAAKSPAQTHSQCGVKSSSHPQAPSKDDPTSWTCAICGRQNDVVTDPRCGACSTSRQHSTKRENLTSQALRAANKAAGVRPLSARASSSSRTSDTASSQSTGQARDSRPAKTRPKSASAARSQAAKTWSTAKDNGQHPHTTPKSAAIPAVAANPAATVNAELGEVERVEYKRSADPSTDKRPTKQKHKRPKSAGEFRSSTSSLGRNLRFSRRGGLRDSAAGNTSSVESASKAIGDDHTDESNSTTANDPEHSNAGDSKIPPSGRPGASAAPLRCNSWSSPKASKSSSQGSSAPRPSEGARLRKFFGGASKDRSKSPSRPSSAPTSRRRPSSTSEVDKAPEVDKMSSTGAVPRSSSSDRLGTARGASAKDNARPSTAGSSRRAVSSALLSRSIGGSNNSAGGRLRDLIARANARTKTTDLRVMAILNDLCESQICLTSNDL